MVLPDHIIKKNDTWFFNEKTLKWIHKDRIEEFCSRYWAVQNKLQIKKDIKEKHFKRDKEIRSAAKRYDIKADLAIRRWSD